MGYRHLRDKACLAPTSQGDKGLRAVGPHPERGPDPWGEPADPEDEGRGPVSTRVLRPRYNLLCSKRAEKGVPGCHVLENHARARL